MSSSSPFAGDAPAVQSSLHLRRYHGSTAARTRFYAHRVRESLTGRVIMFLCSVLLTLLLVAGIIVLILWLSFRPHRPRFYLSSFSAPSLSDFSFSMSVRNPNSKIAISYGDISAAVFYNDRQLASGTILPSLYQPPKNTTEIQGRLAGIAGEGSGERVALRLDLSSTVQFRLSTWDTRDHGMHVSCDLAVGADRKLLPEFQGERCSLYFG